MAWDEHQPRQDTAQIKLRPTVAQRKGLRTRHQYAVFQHSLNVAQAPNMYHPPQEGPGGPEMMSTWRLQLWSSLWR